VPIDIAEGNEVIDVATDNRKDRAVYVLVKASGMEPVRSWRWLRQHLVAVVR